MPHSLNQPQMRLWIMHTLNIVLLVFIVKLQSSSLPCLGNTLFSSLLSFFLNIASKACVFVAPVCHFMFWKSSFEPQAVPPEFTSELLGQWHKYKIIAASYYNAITSNFHTPNQFPLSKVCRPRHHQVKLSPRCFGDQAIKLYQGRQVAESSRPVTTQAVTTHVSTYNIFICRLGL